MEDMEFDRLRIEIDSEHRLGNNEYIRGRIAGIVIGMLGKNRYKYNDSWEVCPDGTHIYHSTTCTTDEAMEIIEVIEDMYPSLCSFY